MTRLLDRVAADLELRAVSQPGLLRLEGDNVERFPEAATAALSPTEAAEVRATWAAPDLSGNALVAAALGAPLLTRLAGRRTHAELHGLLDDESAFYSRYQPIVDLVSGAVIGHEALLRADLDGREITPDRLFGMAEATGRVHILDRIGRETAIRNAGGWLGSDLLFVNFVPTSIYRPELCLQSTERAADEAGISRSQLVFEVVESHRVDERGHLLAILDHYRSRGCRVALDDVGAGYSSLNLLASIKPDVVKIDRELVQGLPGDASTAVVRAITEMAHDLGGTVIAECLETEAQADAARALGVDWGQGWLFGRPARRSAGVAVAG